ncbi:Epidermal patterning factor-like protein, partial [Psidium guajava]
TRPKVKVERATNPNFYRERRPPMRPGRGDMVQSAGSSLPDCSHACGSCSPCRLVMVSFVCASVQEAETCPMAYKCMCNNKSYPVP